MPTPVTTDNPFFAPSTLPFHLPPFGEIREEHYREAFERGMAEQRGEVAAIDADPAPATVENTLVPLERSGRVLDRVCAAFYTIASADSSDFTRALEEEMSPRLTAHNDAISLDATLFARIDAIWRDRDDLGLDAETRYLVERYHTQFVQAGAALDAPAQAELRDLNRRLAELTTRYGTELLAEANDLGLVVSDPAELDGLGAEEIASAAEAARARGLDGKYLIPLILSTNQPALAQLRRRDVRRRLFEASRSRGHRGGAHDVRALVLEITHLRARRAALLGYPSHAAYVTADETARTPEAVRDMLFRLARPAAANARAEAAVLQEEADREADAAGTEHFALAAWDWAYYAERVRRARFDVDEELLRPYFELGRVERDGVFWAAHELYGITFTPRPDLAGYHPDARVFEVDEEDGSALGLFVLDPYTRDSKQGGAWMNSLVSQSELLGIDHAVVINVANFPQPAPGEPTLLTFDEVTTVFHEFGHALHGLFAHVRYPRFSGTNTFRDFVEFPSQVNEMWQLWPEVLRHYAVHHRTGEPMPEELARKVVAQARFNEGFATSEYLAAAWLDQAWHRIGPDEEITDVDAFEAHALAEIGLDDPLVPPRYSSTYFQHTFAGGYDAGYYSYIWSEVLDADTVEWFGEHGGLSREPGERFRRRLLGVGGSRDPLEAYRDFRGRDARIEPLLARRGLDAAGD